MHPMKAKSNVLFSVLFLSMLFQVSAQNLLDTLEAETPEESEVTIATFKATRISIGHSVETRKKGALEISWMNRFWNTPAEQSQTFAADKWNSRIGVEYALSDRFTIGTGYETGYKSIDLLLKYRLFHQKTGAEAFPFSITLMQGGVFRDKSTYSFISDIGFEDKLAATTQILIARKFTSNFSFQIAPSYIYRAEDNLLASENPHYFALGFGARYKVGNHVSIVSEYYYIPDPFSFIDTYGPFSLGVNWEVSDLMLQFKLTNARNFVDDKYITKTTNNFNFRNGNLHFGFHATYFIQL